MFLDVYHRSILGRAESLCRVVWREDIAGCCCHGLVFPLASLHRTLARAMKSSGARARECLCSYGRLVNTLLWIACATELPWLRANGRAGPTVLLAPRNL